MPRLCSCRGVGCRVGYPCSNGLHGNKSAPVELLWRQYSDLLWLQVESTTVLQTNSGLLFRHFCKKIQKKGFPTAVDCEKHPTVLAKDFEALDRWVHYHNKIRSFVEARQMIKALQMIYSFTPFARSLNKAI